MKILKGDKVEILIGKDKGRSGEVLRVFAKSEEIVVKGLNLFKKHLKPTQGQKGGIIEKERPIKASKTMLLCPNCQKRIRVAYSIDKNGDKSRICRKCKSIIVSTKK
ncbi:MAG: 50S ribosomal protein L24 [Candidatus Shapirobacteria bacterium GW2011_GWE1_38_10]|uniref:Large ribosomal subunit protein uL24 n=1 Tax=Candidatus Shapirobacteria bacterium GW2011_GWE1_38_10 TaxID=1618488 RepID=A0A0G0I6J4_9BACT|nr:MAG: 50S ribosomal protein L24 [Candidatus Shapirobacteria bacterium GW2011_GWF2_37_20]KKQ50152.1 MAG: 50S ribosomal protein L24 [Candidatus Shapirobacteria bacterium GW2011_GWE1_38_10]KKQ64745.1 MAG: 50S ribosomal protein L24 [Candidatus Shapirobacteria bacterium GW2011_GWF1_38_23]HBP50901.1 50S ribosomal protein L24 [Candidatus Shapirobacteria bacterium]